MTTLTPPSTLSKSFLMATTGKTIALSNITTTADSSTTQERKEPSRRRYNGPRKNQRVNEGTRQAFQAKSKGELRPTHFLALPLGQHPPLRSRVSEFQSSLLQGSGSNTVKGLDASILVNPRRLHLTLGIMALSTSSPRSFSLNEDSKNNGESQIGERKTIESALELLQSLRPQLLEVCKGTGVLQASLERIGAFETKQGARVLWVSPRENETWEESEEDKEERLKLVRVSNLVHQTFKQAGYITETRPLKLHCTLANTSYRKPASKRGELFSFDDVLASTALQAIATRTPTVPAEGTLGDTLESSGSNAHARSQFLKDRSVRVSLGSYTIPEIQLCVMGSHGPEDEYVSVGSVSLTAGGV